MLPPSCDTGYALLGADIGGQGLYDEATAFGFRQQPPIDLPHAGFEVSTFPPVSEFVGAKIFVAFSAIGQENVSASPLQMALAASAFANGGEIMTPHVMSHIRDSQGNLVANYQPKPWLRATSPQTAQQVSGLMQQVAQHGTAAGIFSPDDDVAAKTGTAQVLNNTATTDWMIAFAPADHPKIAVAVVIPYVPNSSSGPLSDATGATIAGPLMRQMIQAALHP
jgi:peptidoglycan glycosyltransferase